MGRRAVPSPHQGCSAFPREPDPGAVASYLVKNTAYQSDAIERMVTQAERTGLWEDEDLKITFRNGVFTFSPKW